MFNHVKKLFTSVLDKGTYQDSLESLQPQGTWHEAWNAVKESDGIRGSGLTNENSNELFIDLPGEVRGLFFVEERDQYVVFLKGECTAGELGIIDLKKQCYNKLTESADLDLTCDEWVDMEVKVVQPCNQLHLYFSTNDVYKVINLDDPCCEFEVQDLLKADCIPFFDFTINKRGGNLPNGTYWFAAKLRDADGNDTNWFKISKGIHISGEDHIPGQNSKKAINVILKDLHSDYSLVDLAVVSVVAGVTTTDFIDTISYGENRIDYLYSGRTGRELPLDIDIIRARNPRYIRGKNLMQYDGRLVLYNIRQENNLDYQAQANEIETYYDVWVVPSRYADQFSGLRPNENYMPAIQFNYIDGTSSVNFLISGREATAEDLELQEDDCSGCELPAWRLKDTSKRLELFLEDVHTTNRNYNDDIFDADNDRDSNFKDTDLSDEEKDTVNEGEIDKPDPDKWTQDVNHHKLDYGKYLDCICEGAVDVFSGWTAECDGCGDLIGLLTYKEILCFCEARESGSVDEDGGAGLIESLEKLEAENPQIYAELTSGSCAGGNCGGGNCGSGGCSGCGGSGCGNGGVVCNNCNGTGCGTIVSNDTQPFYDVVGEGRFVEATIDYAIKRVRSSLDLATNEMAKFKVCSSDGNCSPGAAGCQLIQTKNKCYTEGEEWCSNNVCYKCISGYWHLQNNIRTYDYRESYQRVSNNRIAEGDAKIPSLENFSFEYIYDEDGCEVIGVKPKKYATGRFGYWETKEIYPFTKNCECDYIYEDLAGKPVRLHRVPSISKEPHFVSFSGGVPNLFDQANMEDKDSFVFFVSFRFENITVPQNLPKPLCPENPYSINYVQRTEANRSVIGSGLALSCFKGEIQGEPHVFAKHGVNAWERYDRAIEPRGPSTFRGGTAVSTPIPGVDDVPADVAPYVIHSLDFHVKQPPLDATDCLFELELSGKGFRHGLGAEGEKPETARRNRYNQKGTRQSLLLNHYRLVRGADDGYVSRCVTSMEQVPSDRIMSKSDDFKYSLCNVGRESCVYAELPGPYVQFVEGDKQGMGTKYGGIDNQGDNASDRSFTGDVLTHSLPIHDVRAHLVTFTRYLPHQYGSPIGQTYIPLGLEGKDFSGSVEGCTGDSFVGYVSFRRTSYISDKTNRKISRRVVDSGINMDLGWFVGNLLSFIFRALGLRNGGYIPDSKDKNDYINIFGGLRFTASRVSQATPDSYGEQVDGQFPDPVFPNHTTIPGNGTDRNAGDNYFYNLLKSNVWTWMNSDANPAYRQTGNPENMEIYWPKTKGVKLDSNYPEGYDWKKTYLNRWFALWEENSKWKLILTAIFLILFDFGIGIWLIVEGVVSCVNGLQAIGGGTYTLQTIGGILAFLLGILLIIFGWLWISHWLVSEEDNILAENLTGMKNLRPDIKNMPEPNIDNYPTYSFDDKRIDQFEDNYWEYNQDLSQPNKHEYSYGMSDPYNVCICPEQRSVEAPYSNKQNLSSPIDAWKNFKLNNTIKISPDNGKVGKIFKLGNKIFIHTSDMLLDLQAGHRSVALDRGSLLLGSGDLFGTPVPIYGGVVEGYGGLQDPNAAYVTNWGYVFPDRESRQWFLFTGGLPKPISDEGIRGFLQDNMNFALLESFPTFENVDNKSSTGIGYSVGVDHKYNRLIVGKIDYKLKDGVELAYSDGKFKDGEEVICLGDPNYFCNTSFTRSYDPTDGSWISRHSYNPLIYAWDRFDMYSFACGGMWKHGRKGNYQVFYDKLHPFIVDVVVRDYESGLTFDYNGTILDTEAFLYNGCSFVKAHKQTFDKVIVFNSFQSSGLLDLDSTEKNVIQRSVQNNKAVPTSYEHKMWVFSDVYDKLLDPKEVQFYCPCGNESDVINELNINNAPSSNLLSDNYLVYRFIFSSSDEVKLFLKRIYTKVSLNTIAI